MNLSELEMSSPKVSIVAQYLFLALLLSSPCMQIPVNEFNDDVSEDQDYMGAVNCSRFVASTPKRKSSDFSFFFPITLEVPHLQS